MILSNEHKLLQRLSSLFEIGTDILQVLDYGLLYFENEADKQLLLVEVENKENKIDSIISKFVENFKNGIKSCWIVVPAMKGIAVYSDSENYQFFHHDDILKDTKLNIEIDLEKVFI